MIIFSLNCNIFRGEEEEKATNPTHQGTTVQEVKGQKRINNTGAGQIETVQCTVYRPAGTRSGGTPALH